MQSRIIVIETSLGLQNFNKKGETKWILVVVVKWRYRANVLLGPVLHMSDFHLGVWSRSSVACVAAGHALSKLETVDIVRLRISAQKLVPTSSRVARIYVSDSDRRLSYAPHDWSNSCVRVTVHHSSLDMSKFTEGSWQRAFTAVKE